MEEQPTCRIKSHRCGFVLTLLFLVLTHKVLVALIIKYLIAMIDTHELPHPTLPYPTQSEQQRGLTSTVHDDNEDDN